MNEMTIINVESSIDFINIILLTDYVDLEYVAISLSLVCGTDSPENVNVLLLSV